MWREVKAGGPGTVIGFESEPVVTLGVRGEKGDLCLSESEFESRGFKVYHIDRGGQATLHNPGQLVIFPVLHVKTFGVRAWIDLLLKVSAATLEEFGKKSQCRPGSPGLYTDQGKIASIGVRIRHGISTHGIAINVCNDLSPFAGIRACGVTNASMDRLGENIAPEAVFSSWRKYFQNASTLTSGCFLTNLDASKSSDVRL